VIPPLFLSRARVRRHVPAHALREMLLPSDHGQRAGAGHRLVWTLFADAADRKRDFLWREADAGTFYLLSRRVPEDSHGLFELDPPKPFEPALGVGDRLRFSLRANATVAKGGGKGTRGKPCDVVMAAIRDTPKGERAAHRAAAIEREGRRWLDVQGSRCGFAVVTDERFANDAVDGMGQGVSVTGYRTLRVNHAGPIAHIGVLDFEGVLEVREPERFIGSISEGFGRAKAFGCGLMLIRRV
jgi:CRISPR system Cascade subunit CasE